MFTIRPYFCLSIVGTIALQTMKGPSRLMRRTLRHSSRSVSQTGLLTPAMPALLTRMSILPKAASVASRACSTPAVSVTSTLNTLVSPPTSLAVFSASAESKSQIATLAPEATKRSVMARPKPCAPPVTIATRPLRSILFMRRDPGQSEHVAAIDDEVDAGGEGALVAAEIDRHGCDLLGGAESAHLLARDEHFPALRPLRGGAVEHRGRLDGAGTDRVAADALGNEVERDRAR